MKFMIRRKRLDVFLWDGGIGVYFAIKINLPNTIISL
jgi:hypothetical protein